MKKDIKAQWVAALRSGEYQQGRGQLNFNGHYCCLGVLCEIAVKAGVAVKTEDFGLRIGYKHKEYDYYDRFSFATPTYGLSQWAALFVEDVAKLSNMNDIKRRSFEEIADWIEENL